MDLMNDFSHLTQDIFEKPLAHYNFTPESVKTDQYTATTTYGNGDRYIQVFANIHPMDYPPYFVVVLGEGGRDFFESDWNSIALWRLQRHFQQTDNADVYSLQDPALLPELLADALDDLLTYGSTFLQGDLGLFRTVRTEQNKERAPYKIWTPDEEGHYTVTDDPMSTRKKQQYS